MIQKFIQIFGIVALLSLAFAISFYILNPTEVKIMKTRFLIFLLNRPIVIDNSNKFYVWLSVNTSSHLYIFNLISDGHYETDYVV